MKKLATVALATCLGTSAYAGMVIDVDAGAGGWIVPSLADGSHVVDVDLNETFNLEAKTGPYAWVSLDHPIFVLPDVKAKYQAMSLSGTKKLSSSDLNTSEFNFAGADKILAEYLGPDATELTTTVDLSHLDVILAWGLPLPLVDINFGIDARIFTGSVGFENATLGEKSESFTFAMPMGYLYGAFNVPGVGLQLVGEYAGIPAGGGDGIHDWRLGARYFLPLPIPLADIGFEGGYKQFSMKFNKDKVLGVDVSDYKADVSVGGFYAGFTANVGI